MLINKQVEQQGKPGLAFAPGSRFVIFTELRKEKIYAEVH